MQDSEKKTAPAQEAQPAAEKPAELNDAELGEVAGGNIFDDIVEWIEDWMDDVVEVHYSSAAGKYFCPHCNDGEHMLGRCSTVYNVSEGEDADVYKCDRCGKWFWHYISGDRAGKWRYRPE